MATIVQSLFNILTNFCEDTYCIKISGLKEFLKDPRFGIRLELDKIAEQ